jgi:hypothetical protein
MGSGADGCIEMGALSVRVPRRAGRAVRQPLRPESAIPLVLLVAFVTIGAIRQSGGTLTVVNLIPASLSHDSAANHEPYLAVNPTSPNIMVATVHNLGRGFCKSTSHAPLLVSIDGGSNWRVVCALTTADAQNVQDGTVQFSPDGNALFAGTLRWRAALAEDQPSTGNVVDAYIQGIRKSDLPEGEWASMVNELASWPDAGDDTPMTILLKRKHTDQPILATAATGGNQVVAVGANDFHMWSDNPSSICRTGSVYLSTAPFDKDGFTSHCVARRLIANTMPRTPAVRTAVHRDGTVYALFYRPVLTGDRVDVVVVRADGDQLQSADPFTALKDLPDGDTDESAAGTESADCDRHDGKPGIRVATCVPNPFKVASNDFGQERRVQSQLSVVVHPTNSSTVYIAWASSVRGADAPRLHLHVQVSTDRGETWSDRNGVIVANAINPSLAIAADGTVGLLYQRLTDGTCPVNPVRWETRIDLFDANLTSPVSTQLASVKACAPARVGVPYIGDYLRLQAVGNDFYGVFSASNDLATGTFPATLKFPRRHSGTTLTDKDGNVVPVSIDPFFFKLTR